MTDKLIIFDTTLRDGEQSPGASMTRDEKLRIARQLERLRVDVIEAGFAASSNGDFEAVKTIADAIKDSTICSLSRANDRDIARAAEPDALCGDRQPAQWAHDGAGEKARQHQAERQHAEPDAARLHRGLREADPGVQPFGRFECQRARTPACSPADTRAEATSMRSIFNSSSKACAMLSFSAAVNDTPCVCSPSRRVVSKR